jgi:GNAT superfamily N-acetyltransferase
MPPTQATQSSSDTQTPVIDSGVNPNAVGGGNDFDQFIRQRTGRSKRESKTASGATATDTASTAPGGNDFDAFMQKRQTTPSSVTRTQRLPGGRFMPPSNQPVTPEVAEFNRKQSIVEDWLGIKRDIFASNSKVKIPDLPADLQAFARTAGYPEFVPGNPQYGHFGSPTGETMSQGVVERNLARLKRIGSEIGGQAGEAFANPATESEMRTLERTSPKTAQSLKNVGAVGKSFGETVGGVVADPSNVALMEGMSMLPRLGQRLASLGFAGMMGHDVYQQSGQLRAIWDRTDIPQERKVELATNMILNTAMMTAAATHGIRKGKPAPINVEDQMLSEIDALGKDAADQIAARINRKLTIKQKLQAGVQRAAGTGARLTEKVTEKAVADTQAANAAEREKATKAEAKHAEAQADYNTKISRINEDFDDKITKAKQSYTDDVSVRDKKVSELQAQHADKVAEARREWVEKTHAARETERAQAKVEGRREALRSQQKSYADLIKENVKAAHANVRGALDARWNQLREAIGTETPVSPAGIYDAVEASRAMLAGVPADLKIFNDVFREITEPDAKIESPDGPKPAPREYISFDSARTQYSAVGEKAYAADGNLRRALFNVYDAYDKALSKTATDAGQGKQYAAVKQSWSQYMKDWHDMSSTATGGSPLARVYRAVDSPVVTANVAGKFGDRLFGTFARYEKYGANPALMPKLRNSMQELASLPKVKVVKPPGKLEPPAEPKLPEPVESPHGKVAELEASRAKAIERTEKPAPVQPPTIKPNPTTAEMIDTVRRAKVEKAKDFAAGQKWHPYDLIMASWVAFGLPDAAIEGTLSRATVHAAMYFGVRVGWMKFVRSPMGMDWMTKVTPADIDTISKVLAKYPSERVEAGKAITETLEDTVRNGGPAPNIGKFGAILTDDQKREIMKTVKDINDLKALGITPPDITAKADKTGKTVPPLSSPDDGTAEGLVGHKSKGPRYPQAESSAAAGGSGTAAGAAADNDDIAQARKNLNLAPGQWDTRLLSEAQKLKDQRLSSTPAAAGGYSIRAEEQAPLNFTRGETPGYATLHLSKDGAAIGRMDIGANHYVGVDKAVEIKNVRIPPELQRQGHGSVFYDQAAKYARDHGADYLVSDTKREPDAEGMWKSLERKHPDVISYDATTGRWRWDLRKQ